MEEILGAHNWLTEFEADRLLAEQVDNFRMNIFKQSVQFYSKLNNKEMSQITVTSKLRLLDY